MIPSIWLKLKRIQPSSLTGKQGEIYVTESCHKGFEKGEIRSRQQLDDNQGTITRKDVHRTLEHLLFVTLAVNL